MIFGYARVSTKSQARDGNSLEAQERQLKAAGADFVFKDSFSGRTKDRPEFDKLMDVIKDGDQLIVCKLDRLSRTAREGIEIIQMLLDKGVSVQVLNMGIIDTSPTGKLILQIMLAFAEFERDMIVERTQTGKAIAKMNPNYREGRPPKYDDDQIHAGLKLLDEGISYSKVTKITGISKSTLIRAKRKRDIALLSNSEQ